MFSKVTLTTVAAAICAAASLSASAAAAGNGKCLPRHTLVESLSKKYNEQLTGGGLQNPNQLLEIWTSPKSGSFTVIITRADGMACVMATGKHWNSNMAIQPEGVKS